MGASYSIALIESCFGRTLDCFSALAGETLAGETEYATASSSPLLSACSESRMERMESGKRTSVEDQIEMSRSHWSELVESDSDEEKVAEVENVEVFKTLQMHPKWGTFFGTFFEGEGYLDVQPKGSIVRVVVLRKGDRSPLVVDHGKGDQTPRVVESPHGSCSQTATATTGPSIGRAPIPGPNFLGGLVVGDKFAEGGQAEIYHAKVKWHDPKTNEDDLKEGTEWVLKVFKKGTFLRHLQRQWPQTLFQFHTEMRENHKRGKRDLSTFNHNDIQFGTLLKDGRFAFVMRRKIGDLRGLIDLNVSRVGKGCRPFPKQEAEVIMYSIARGMDWLHSRNIVHRDVKASNVLIGQSKEEGYVGISFSVADFECSSGVVGTGFFRAPEILQALKDGTAYKNPKVFSKAADVYGYGMTCYEILTGKDPFEGHSFQDYDIVLNGHRPKVPEYVDDWVRKLLGKCWHPNPAARPSFGEILRFIAAKSTEIRSQIDEFGD